MDSKNCEIVQTTIQTPYGGFREDFTKKSTRSHITKNSWTNTHEKLRKFSNSYKLVYKCPKWTLQIVRLYVLLPLLFIEGFIKVLQINPFESISPIYLWLTHMKN